MINVGILIKNLQVGGAQKQSIILGSVLRNEFNLSFIVFNGNILSERFLSMANDSGLESIILKGNLLKRLYNFYRICRKNHIEILFSYLAGDNLVSASIGRMAGVKHQIGGIRNSEILPFKLVVQRFLSNKLFTYTVFNNQMGLEALIKKGFLKEKCVLIENAIYINQMPITRNRSKNISILTIARFEDQKDHHTAIRSIHFMFANKLIYSEKKIKYCIIGKGSQQSKLENWIQQYELQSIVEIIIDPLDIESYLRNTDIYLSTSLFEGISNTIMEAMLYSMPVVATNVGDNCRLIEDGYNGFLVRVGDYADVADKLAYLINNDQERITYGHKSFSILNERFSPSKFQLNYRNLISSLKEAF